MRIKPAFILCLLCITLLAATALTDDWTRPALLAGKWYPSNPKLLRASLDAHMAGAPEDQSSTAIRALIVPHAGHVYSGKIAGKAWALASRLQPKPHTVILVGPSHHLYLEAPSIWPKGALNTPLGPVHVNQELAARLQKLCNAGFNRDAHLREHSLEVQLPFVKYALPGARVVAVLASSPDLSRARALGGALAKAASEPGVLLAASTDLSHFFAHEKAKTMDAQLADYMRQMDPEGLWLAAQKNQVQACGLQALTAVMFAARELGADAGQILVQGSSGEVNQDYSRVVGYLAAALSKSPDVPSPNNLSANDKKQLLELAKQALQSSVMGKPLPILKKPSSALKQERAVFITLTKNGLLRGCIGHIRARMPLHEAVVGMTRATALHDPRFGPVRPNEAAQLDISISVLTPMQQVKPSDVKVGRDGLVIRVGGRVGVLLPQVPVEQGWDREAYLRGICQKAGLPDNAWQQPDAKLWRFEAEIIK